MDININDKGPILTEQELYLNRDLDTVFTFKHWAKDNIELYKDKKGTNDKIKDVPYEHLLIYLEYLTDTVMRNKEIDRSAWIKQIGRLIVKTKKIIRNIK